MNRRHFFNLNFKVALAYLVASPRLRRASAAPAPTQPQTPIDRQALVNRHKVVRTHNDAGSPLQVGNGNFAFGADITGLQTFTPFNTLSHWGWHSFPLPPGQQPSDFRGQNVETHGRVVNYPIPNPEQPALSAWLYANPHRCNLGRIGLRLLKANGTVATLDDLTACHQELDLWTGTLASHFELEGQAVQVTTCCHPDVDAIAVRIESPLIAAKRLSVFIDFPYDDGREFANYLGDWSSPEAHHTQAQMDGKNRVHITRQMDDARYYVSLAWQLGATLQLPPPNTANLPLTIRHAEYGAGEHWVDVTAQLAAAIKDNNLNLTINNALAGDPALNTPKRLKVSYTLGQAEHQLELRENEILRLPTESIKHRFTLLPGQATHLEFTCAFAPTPLPRALPDAATTFAASARYWSRFWQSGGAIDLSQSLDPRWIELERRIVLSQYLMAVNEAGALPPQESGLVNNGWNGKFHLEMYWWHAAHWALWNRWPLLQRSLGFYQKFLPSAQARARHEGYQGAHWPKCTGPTGRESPHPIHAWLIWQQPHPLFFAELDYRAHPTHATLEQWRDVVFATGDFLASYAFWDNEKKNYTLGPPLYVVSENTDPKITHNPTFELAYWRFGLRVAQTWRERLGLPRNAEWDKVLHGLAPLPVEDDCYVLYEGIPEMWTKWNFEHPALTGVYGWLPGDGVDVATMRRTAQRVFSGWQFNRVWGWDFPMLAMCAARLGEPEQAINFLLHSSPNFQFNDAGYATGGPFPYFPSNGGLLYTVAMLAAGWDGAPSRHAPGFPDNGQWTVRWENLHPAI